MPADRGLVDLVAEALEPVGAVTSRAMMGGWTLYLDGTVFAIVGDDTLWFKADGASDAAWDAMGAARFTYEFPNGRIGSMNYRRAPENAYDDADEIRRLAALAVEAGRRAPVKKAKRK